MRIALTCSINFNAHHARKEIVFKLIKFHALKLRGVGGSFLSEKGKNFLICYKNINFSVVSFPNATRYTIFDRVGGKLILALNWKLDLG